MKFALDLSLPEGADPIQVADWILDLLCNFGPADDAPYDSCGGVEPIR